MFNKPLLVNTVLFCISYINDLIGKPKGWIATRQNLELTIPYVMNKNDEFVFKKTKKHCSNRNCRLNISVVHFSWYGRFWWTAIYQSQRVQPTRTCLQLLVVCHLTQFNGSAVIYVLLQYFFLFRVSPVLIHRKKAQLF